MIRIRFFGPGELIQNGFSAARYHLHAEGQSDELQQSQAVLRQHLERSNTEGAQLMNLYEETRIANASIAPELTRPLAREDQLSTRVSKMRNQETELRYRDSCCLHQQTARIIALLKQIQITSSSMNT